MVVCIQLLVQHLLLCAAEYRIRPGPTVIGALEKVEKAAVATKEKTVAKASVAQNLGASKQAKEVSRAGRAFPSRRPTTQQAKEVS